MRESLHYFLQSYDLLIESYDSANAFFANTIDLAIKEENCLIFSEYDLPDMTAIKLQHTLTQQKLNIPMIMIATNPSLSDVVMAMRAGILDVLEKPFIELKMIEHLQKMKFIQ